MFDWDFLSPMGERSSNLLGIWKSSFLDFCYLKIFSNSSNSLALKKLLETKGENEITF